MNTNQTQKQSYWTGNGKYQREADILQKSVPDKGESFDTRIELFRCASNIYYDMFNNGMDNCDQDDPRSEQYLYVASNVEMGFVEEFMKVLQKEQEIDQGKSKSRAMFSEACDAMDLVMDRVIEKITKTGFFKQIDEV